MAELNNLATIGKWMIYGAYGYTGKLVVEEAVKRGHLPVVAGQNEEKVLDLAEQYNLPFRVFPLDHPRKIKSHLADVGVVLNCAGPFSQTAKPLREACIDCGVHYLDITGEIEVLEESYQSHPAAREAGVVVISGVGFDVVPTDMLASLLKEQLPTATHLELAFAGGGGISPGTAKTMLEMVAQRGRIRRDGEMVQVPLAWRCREVPFSDMPRHCTTIPWGDVSTAFHSTGIPNVMVYTAVEKGQARWMKWMNPLVGFLAKPAVQAWLRQKITDKVDGPTKEQRDAGFMRIWGRVSDGQREVEMTMDTPEGYNYTVLASLVAVEALLAHKIMPGAYTPSQVLEREAITGMEGVTIEVKTHAEN